MLEFIFAQFGSVAPFFVGVQTLDISLYPLIQVTQFPLDKIKLQNGGICTHLPRETK
jgi:hypothetical protein